MKGAIAELYGIKIIANDAIPEKQPILELSRKINVSDRFRAEMNAWLLEKFGYVTVMYVFSAPDVTGKQEVMMVNSKVLDKFKRETMKYLAH